MSKEPPEESSVQQASLEVGRATTESRPWHAVEARLQGASRSPSPGGSAPGGQGSELWCCQDGASGVPASRYGQGVWKGLSSQPTWLRLGFSLRLTLRVKVRARSGLSGH